MCILEFFSNFSNRPSGEDPQDDLAINVDNLWGTILKNSKTILQLVT